MEACTGISTGSWLQGTFAAWYVLQLCQHMGRQDNFRVSQNWGVPYKGFYRGCRGVYGPYKRDYNSLWSILGSPFWETTNYGYVILNAVNSAMR